MIAARTLPWLTVLLLQLATLQATPAMAAALIQARTLPWLTAFLL
jgi:hypothetical protein